MWKSRRWVFGLSCLLAAFVIGCGETEETGDCRGTGPARCIGGFVPDEIGVSDDGRQLTIAWVPSERSPLCVLGGNFRAFIRKANPAAAARNVTIYLPNDGAWLPTSANIMLSRGAAPLSMDVAPQTNFMKADQRILGDTDFLYVSACDGSLYVGDRDYSVEELAAPQFSHKEARYYRGFVNTVASINELARQNPRPEKVFVIGSGAGSFGVILASMHAAATFPQSQIYVFQDGSPGLGMGDLDTSFVTNLIEGWSIAQSLPSACHDCGTHGHLTPYIDFALRNYPNMRYGVYVSTIEQAVPKFINLSNPRGAQQVESHHFQCFIQQELEKLRATHADSNRYNYYVVKVSGDTVAAVTDRENPERGLGESYQLATYDGSPTIRFDDWFEQFATDSPDWKSYSEVEMKSAFERCADAVP